MENTPPPVSPFDALDFTEDLGATDLFPTSLPQTASNQHAIMGAVRRKLQELHGQIQTLLSMLERETGGVDASAPRTAEQRPSIFPIGDPLIRMATPSSYEPRVPTITYDDKNALRVIEGVFDGQHMVGPDGKHYSVPANYASKSKLIEGDILKLTITNRGAFVYKQIGPIARERRIGILERDDVTNEFVVIVPDNEEDRSELTRAIIDRLDLPTTPYRRYRTLRASVSYYQGEAGDEVVVLVPKDAPSTWAAVENIIKR